VSPLAVVTGATGFAGSHVADALVAGGWRVRVPVRATSSRRWLPAAGVECVPAELRDPASLPALVSGAAWVFHFGGLTRASRRASFFEVNTEGTLRLWRASREAGAAGFVFCSSLAAGGPSLAADRPRREADPPAPITAYGRSKLAAEERLLGDAESGTRLVIVRPPAVYGPRDTAVLEFFRWVSRGILPLPPRRDARLSLVHARDLARACLHLVEAGATGVFHVSDGEFHSWEDMGRAAGLALGRRPRALRLPAPGVRLTGWVGEALGRLTGTMPVVNADKARDILQPFWTCDIERLRGSGFIPRIGVAEGCRETVEWYRKEGWL
jgi:nucleoside-diphosphate-sugar epimerase